MAILMRRWLATPAMVMLTGCFSATLDPTGHPCDVDADCALGEGLVCDPTAGVCVAADGSGGTTLGDEPDASTSGASNSSGASSSGSDDDASSDGTVDPDTTTGEDPTDDGSSSSGGEPAELSVDTVVPDKGRTDIVREVVITGSGFGEGVTVSFGDDVASIVSVTPDALTVQVPAHPGLTGPVDVQVVQGRDQIDLPGAYRRVSANPVFEPWPVVDLLQEPLVPAASDLIIGDFVGDAALDLVISRENPIGSVIVAEGDGAGGFSIAWEHPDAALSLTAADIDEDGDLDFAAITPWGLRAFENDGFGGFLVTSFPGQIGYARGIAALDLDHVDGPDLVVRGSYDAGIQTWLNDGNGGFLVQSTLSAGQINSIDWITSPSVGDFDGDGWDDVVTPVEPPLAPVGGFATYLNDGTGGLLPPVFTSLGANGTASTALHSNPGADATLDVLGLTYATGIHSMLGNGDGTFDASVAPGSAPTGLRKVEAPDLNCDDVADLVIIDWIGTYIVDRGSLGGSFSPSGGSTFAPNGNNRGMAVGDLDGDGLPDIVISHHTPDAMLQLYAFRNRSADE